MSNLQVLNSIMDDLDSLLMGKVPCPHKNTFYQPKEQDTHTPESLTCEDCGEDLPLPEWGTRG